MSLPKIEHLFTFCKNDRCLSLTGRHQQELRQWLIFSEWKISFELCRMSNLVRVRHYTDQSFKNKIQLKISTFPRLILLLFSNNLEQIPEESSEGKKTWKGKVAKQWKKIQQQGPNPQGPLSTYPEGGSIGNLCSVHIKPFISRNISD